MITSALDMFDKEGTVISSSGPSANTVYNGYNNNRACDDLYLVVHRTAGTGAISIKLQTTWDDGEDATWTDVVDFGACTEDVNGNLLKVKVPKGKPVLGKYLRLYYTTTAEQTIGAFLTFGADEDVTDVVVNPAFNLAGKPQPKV
jgi:hypothetical protein